VDQLAARPRDGRRKGVEQAQVESVDRFGGHPLAGRARYPLQQLEPALLLLEGGDGREVSLRIELKAGAVDVAVQMDGEAGHPTERSGEPHEARRAVFEHDAAGQTQIAVEPGVPQHAAVDFDRQLLVAVLDKLGLGLEAQVGGVGVSADDRETGFGR
jgi:hypothetical protein